MKKIYLFGDSFSTNYYSPEAKEIPKEKSWPHLLAKKLGYKLVDVSYPGISNEGMLQMIYKYLNMHDCDLAIFGLTFFDRIYDTWIDAGIELSLSDVELKKMGIRDYEIEFYKKRFLDGERVDKSIGSQMQKFYFLFKTLKSFNKKFVFWSLENTNNHVFLKLVSDFKEEFMISPLGTNDWFKSYIDKNPLYWQENTDRHFGIYGHQKFFEFISEFVENRPTFNQKSYNKELVKLKESQIEFYKKNIADLKSTLPKKEQILIPIQLYEEQENSIKLLNKEIIELRNHLKKTKPKNLI